MKLLAISYLYPVLINSTILYPLWATMIKRTKSQEQRAKIKEHRTRNTKRRTWNMEHGTRNMEHGTRNTEHGTRNTEHGTRNTEHGTRNTKHGTRNTEHGTWNMEHGTRNAELFKLLNLFLPPDLFNYFREIFILKFVYFLCNHIRSIGRVHGTGSLKNDTSFIIIAVDIMDGNS